jgi:hypothetical protein
MDVLRYGTAVKLSYKDIEHNYGLVIAREFTGLRCYALSVESSSLRTVPDQPYLLVFEDLEHNFPRSMLMALGDTADFWEKQAMDPHLGLTYLIHKGRFAVSRANVPAEVSLESMLNMGPRDVIPVRVKRPIRKVTVTVLDDAFFEEYERQKDD